AGAAPTAGGVRAALDRRDLRAARGLLRQAEERVSLRRVSLRVSFARAEEAPAAGIGPDPQGVEEGEHGGGVELAAYTDADPPPGALIADVEPGWEERWREFHRPVRVGKLWVGPPRESPPDESVAIVVDPGRAFGTGAHPTTRLCLELLLE